MTNEEKPSRAVARAGSVALAPIAEGAEEKLAVMREALGGDTLALKDFEVIKTPAGGARNWELPDGTAVPKIEGVVILRQTSRAFWKEPYGQGETPVPDCVATSVTGDRGGTGVGDNTTGPGVHDCATCPMSEFGSATNDKGEPMAGQACQLRTRLFVYPKGGDSMLPWVISLGPSAFQATRAHFVGKLGARGIPVYGETTVIGLEQAESKQGNIKYSKPAFERGELLDPETRQAIERVRSSMLPHLEATAGRVLEGEYTE